MVRAESARRLLCVLLDNLSDLRRYQRDVSRERLHADRDAQHLVLHSLYLAVQACVDLAMHLGADAGLPQAQSYQHAFKRLGESGAIDKDLADRLAGWAGFRNVLAHFYPIVDYNRVYDALSELDDLEEFARIVARVLQG